MSTKSLLLLILCLVHSLCPPQDVAVQLSQPVHAQRAYDARPQADSLPSNGPTLPFLQPPGIHTRTPNGPGQIPFIGVGIASVQRDAAALYERDFTFPPPIAGASPVASGYVALGPMTPFEAKAIVDALIDASLRGVTPKVAFGRLAWPANPPQGSPGAPAPASGKEPVVEQAPAPSSELESQGQPSAHLSRSAAPGSASVKQLYFNYISAPEELPCPGRAQERLGLKQP
ncbi:hypothetical protein C8R43DRAFT_950594 [Mycena crocata]|nr:hypothetical protein C8R43DRAFT_950594 [Mycena crocata]